MVPPESRESWVFLPLSAGDFHSGWALDWSPELRSSALRPPRRHVKRRG
jgi:hypothetical protein